jgi:hypothetical protein
MISFNREYEDGIKEQDTMEEDEPVNIQINNLMPDEK